MEPAAVERGLLAAGSAGDLADETRAPLGLW